MAMEDKKHSNGECPTRFDPAFLEELAAAYWRLKELEEEEKIKAKCDRATAQKPKT